MKVLELNGVESLKDRYAFYMPTLNASEEIDRFVMTVCGITKGATIIPNARGIWINNMAIYDEKVNILEVYCKLTLAEEQVILEAFNQFGLDTNQHSLAIARNNKMFVVEVER